MDPALVQTVACQAWHIWGFLLRGLLQRGVDSGPELSHLYVKMLKDKCSAKSVAVSFEEVGSSRDIQGKSGLHSHSLKCY